MGIYIGDVASREAGANNKGTVNLDDVAEQTLPMLSNTSTAQDLRTVSNVTNTSGNEASSELSDHVSKVQAEVGRKLSKLSREAYASV